MNTFSLGFIVLILISILILIFFLSPCPDDITDVYDPFGDGNYMDHFKNNWDRIDPLMYPIHSDRIFVSIASYRDPEITRTVRNIIENATNPHNLTIYVYEQNDPTDVTTKDLPESVLSKSNVIVNTVNYSEAKGPNWARYLIQQEWSGEEYFLQIDSHTQFVVGWDVTLIDMLKQLQNGNTKVVLTQYPPEYELKDGKYDTNVLRGSLYVEGFQPSDNFTRIQSEYHQGEPPSSPFVSEAWGACFSFSSWEIIRDAPYDPYLPYLFFGEELDITLRLYTHGWNIYSPHKSVVFTNFTRTHRNTMWSDHEKEKREKYELLSRIRLYHKFGMNTQLLKYNTHTHTLLLNNIDKYDLGSERDLKDYENHAGIDLNGQRVVGHNRKRIIDINRKTQYDLNHIMFWEWMV